MDTFILTSTKDRSAAAITSASDTTALVGPDGFPQLVLGTTEPITAKFLTSASAYESWSGDATYDVTVSLGALTADGLSAYSTATLSTAISNGKSGDLALTTQALVDACKLFLSQRPRAPSLGLTLQFDVTDPSGNKRTYAQLPVTLNFRVPPFTPTADSPDTYLTAAQSVSKSDLRFFPSVVFFGNATDEQTFGYFYAEKATKILGKQIAAQVAPVGANLTVDIVNSAGTEQSKVSTLTAGTQFERTLFATALELAAGSYVRFKIKSVGSTTPGGYLTINLICQLNT